MVLRGSEVHGTGVSSLVKARREAMGSRSTVDHWSVMV